MKKLRVLDWIVCLMVALLLIGSFPVKSRCGQRYCDIMRLLGWSFLAIHLYLYWFLKKNDAQ